jgi:hypothetical protein
MRGPEPLKGVRMTDVIKHAAFATLIVLAVAVSPGDAVSHDETKMRPSADRVPVTVALVANLPVHDTPYMVQRRSRAPHNVILLREDATALDLSAAVAQFMLSTQASAGASGGGQGRVPADAPLRSRLQAGAPMSFRELPWAPQVLDDLHQSRPAVIPGIGSVRSVVIWLPAVGENYVDLS